MRKINLKERKLIHAYLISVLRLLSLGLSNTLHLAISSKFLHLFEIHYRNRSIFGEIASLLVLNAKYFRGDNVGFGKSYHK